MSATGLRDRLRQVHHYAAAELAHERALADSIRGTNYPERYVQQREREAERLGKALRYLTAARDALGDA